MGPQFHIARRNSEQLIVGGELDRHGPGDHGAEGDQTGEPNGHEAGHGGPFGRFLTEDRG